MSHAEHLQSGQSQTERQAVPRRPLSPLGLQMASGQQSEISQTAQDGGSPQMAYHDNASQSCLLGKLEVFQVLDVLDGIRDLHHALHEGQFEADVL